jgi:cytochrome d ubiquinol oxidase subunit II
MFETFETTTLQQYWFIIIAVLGALLVLLLFVQGGQSLIKTLAKTDEEKTLLINTFGRKWEFTFTTLVTFGGAFFASFPLFYSTSFGGAYWVWLLILFAFIIQAVSYEYRSKPNNFLGAKTFEMFLLINGFLAPVLLGAAVATFFTGSPFHVNELSKSFWDSPFYGLELALDLTRFGTFLNLALGLAVLFLARILANLYILNSINHSELLKRTRKSLMFNTIPFLVFFLFFLISILMIDGYAVDDQGVVSMESHKYFTNLIEMPLNTIILLLGVLMVLWGIIRAYFFTASCGAKGIWFSGLGTVLTVFALFLLAAFNNTAYYPSFTDLQSSLTIYNSSSSHYTLVAMSYVSLMVPFVIGYIWYAWRAINSSKMDAKELDDEGHVY